MFDTAHWIWILGFSTAWGALLGTLHYQWVLHLSQQPGSVIAFARSRAGQSIEVLAGFGLVAIGVVVAGILFGFEHLRASDTTTVGFIFAFVFIEALWTNRLEWVLEDSLAATGRQPAEPAEANP